MKLDPFQTQRERNLETRTDRAQFAEHRAHVMRLILNNQASATDRLCILGAGNCNDLELPELVDRFEEIHLIDVDRDSLEAATTLASVTPNRVTLHEADLAGWYGHVDGAEAHRDNSATMIQKATETYRPDIAGSPFDIVISSCLISQVIESAVLAIGHDHPQLTQTILSIRSHHLRTLLQLASRGGRVVLITDFVSSLTLPQLATVSPENFQHEVRSALATGNFFTGLNPAAIAHLLTTDEQFGSVTEDVCLTDPWLWNLGPRTFAVTAISFSHGGSRKRP